MATLVRIARRIPRLGGLGLRRLRHLRLGVWGCRVAVLLLFASLTLSLTAGFIYVLDRTLLPKSSAGLVQRAVNVCTDQHPPRTADWRECMGREPRAPSQNAMPFLLLATAAGLGGLGLVIVGGRGRPRILIPALMIAAVVSTGTGLAARERDRDEERYERIRETAVRTAELDEGPG